MPRGPASCPDMVAKNKVWAEACEKEVRMIKLNTTFALGNLKDLDVFPEKPNLLKAETVPDEAEMEEAKELLNTLCSVKDTGALPNEKYDMPMTSSQEVGFWDTSLSCRSTRCSTSLGLCEITLHADAYYHTTGVTPLPSQNRPAEARVRDPPRDAVGTRGERVDPRGVRHSD